MMLSAAEDMRTTIYNSPLFQLRHTVLPYGTGARVRARASFRRRVCVGGLGTLFVCVRAQACSIVENLGKWKVGDDRQSGRTEPAHVL